MDLFLLKLNVFLSQAFQFITNIIIAKYKSRIMFDVSKNEESKIEGEKIGTSYIGKWRI